MRLALVTIAGANLDFRLLVENVQLRHHQRINSVEHLRVAQNHQIEPSAATGPPGDRTELVSARPNFVRVQVRHLGRKRPAADARRVSLRHA